MNEQKKPGFEIQLDEQVAQGNYCNLAIIAHSTSEFILDFATMTPLQIYPSEYTCTTAPKASEISGITYHRQLRGLTQIQLAEQMGISPHHISLYEKGEREPKATTYQRIAELLEVSIDALLATYPVSAYEQ